MVLTNIIVFSIVSIHLSLPISVRGSVLAVSGHAKIAAIVRSRSLLLVTIGFAFGAVPLDC